MRLLIEVLFWGVLLSLAFIYGPQYGQLIERVREDASEQVQLLLPFIDSLWKLAGWLFLFRIGVSWFRRLWE